MGHSLSGRARWHARIGSVGAPAALRPWLTDKTSLTAKLTGVCSTFRVRLLREASGRGMEGEAEAMGLPRRARLWMREVLLQCDGISVVYARTAVPSDGLAEWPWLHRLGENSLGSSLFADPRIFRGAMEFAALKNARPIRRAMSRAFEHEHAEPLLYARRSKFGLGRNWLLVTEVFLPPILQLTIHEPSV